ISMTKADLRLAVQRLISSSIVMLMSVISTHYDLSRISVGHYMMLQLINAQDHTKIAAIQCADENVKLSGQSMDTIGPFHH
ncbi:hypothetical protein, partial [Klebsiella pneumoniae]|uniref:hypothetical protein n=1 Tax=Klebsiella pneumoniae TaxID=573 RepID=UPI001C69B9F1